jgi:hypothetical protein
VLSARGSEFEAEIAFGVARQLFEPMLRAASAGERRRLLGGVARMGAQAVGVAMGEPPADRFAAFHGLYWLLANRADRGPIVVSVDDVQWADDPSLAWLGYVARRAEDLAVVLAVALRSGDPGGERGEVDGLVRAGGVERLALGPLSAAAVGTIVRAQLDEQADEPFGVQRADWRQPDVRARVGGCGPRGGIGRSRRERAGVAPDRADGGRALGTGAAGAAGC